ncbi:MAG: sigma-54 dependent transcriptional regulator [Polyangiaceae bacterium]|nr:sigma-54 dependent transcriptional regulator [Polyangiaceae bacterium]
MVAANGAESLERKARVLVVDDQRNMRTTLSMLLKGAGHDVDQAENGTQACEMGVGEAYDVVLTDLRLGEPDGMAVLKAVKEGQPSCEVIVMTAYGTIESAVEAMRLGAFDCLQKPFSEQELLVKIEKARESRKLRSQVEAFAQEFREKYGFENIVGRSAAVKDLLTRVVRIAPTDVTALITGESGTGKELIARAIHANSRRAERPFITVNCAAITETLLESELFGHAKGAFTGASTARKGLLEDAEGGTFFFDEIAETTPAFQAKLLRTLQEGEVRRVGDNRAFKVDIRVIAATNVDLAQAVEEKRFREDLYYRLNVARFRVPPLRERREDIPLLIDFFLQKYNQKMNTQSQLQPGVLDRLISYDFPGNVREIENLVEQAVALAGGGQINLDDIMPGAEMVTPPEKRTLAGIVDQAERLALEEALSTAGGNRERAAETLGISPTTLWRKMTRLKVKGGPRA